MNALSVTNPDDTVWQAPELVKKYLAGVRGAIPLAREQLDVMLRLLSQQPEPIRNFLDLGCGDGILAAAIIDRFPRAQATLVDFSEPMLAAARSRLAAHAMNSHFISTDFGSRNWLDLVCGRSPFDAVVSGFSIHHQADQRKRELYAEIHRLLKPGGVFVNLEHVASPTPWVEMVHDESFIDALSAFNASTGKSRQQIADEYYHRPDKAANILAPVERQCEWLREIGYEDVDCYFKIFELAAFGGRRAK